LGQFVPVYVQASLCGTALSSAPVTIRDLFEFAHEQAVCYSRQPSSLPKALCLPFNKASLFPRATTYEADIKRSRCPPSDTIKQHLGFTLNAQRTRDIVSGAER
jgi:hypothetical protein